MSEQSKATTTANACAACGRNLPTNAPGGLCPACLLERGVALATRASARPGDFVPPAPEELAVLFPEFEIVSLLGRGGMGAVYKAVQPDLDRTVAVKLLPPETARDAEFMERFRREAATLARLDHPGIVRLYDFGQRDDFAYFVMEFVDGVDLAQQLAAGPMSPPDAFEIVGQLCDALQHSHERGVIHRDLKPANILIARDGRVKLADFGLARLTQPDAGEMGLTRTGARLGTPRYMAPEQLNGVTADHRVDVYALGVVLYEMLTAQLPVGHFDPPSEKIPALTPRLDEVVLRALNAEPERRFASMIEVKERLRDAVARPGLTRPERRQQLARRVFAASLLAAIIGAGAVWLWSSRDASHGQATQPTGPITERATLPSGRLIVFGGATCPVANERVSAVALGGGLNEFGLALLPDGTVRAWGDNRFGQTNVPAGLREVIAIAAGQGAKSAHALALRADGTVAGWGDNTFGQAVPPMGLTNVAAIVAGELHSLAMTREGRVVAWGNGTSPALAVPKNLPPAKAIATGADFSLALSMDGRVTAWGVNERGQCDVPPSAQSVVQFAAGSHHALALLADGKVIAWGGNSSQQCDVPATLPPATAVFAGGDGSAALDASGALRVWGKVPMPAAEFKGRVAQVVAGSQTWLMIEKPAATAVH